MGESIQCWQCGTRMTLDELASNDGDCPRCEVEVHLAEYLDNALSKVATLEAENAKLRAELGRRVPDGWSVTEDGNSIIVRPDGRMAVELSKGGRPGERVMWEFMRAMLSAAQSAPATGQGDGWIPVSERLPSVAQEVIVNSEFDGVTAGFLDSYGEWYSPNSDYKLTRVVTWQPLPAARPCPPAPKGAKDE